MGKRIHRPKRLFRAIVACGVALTACGGGGSPTDGGVTDAAQDAKKDATGDAQIGFDDAGADADAYAPPADADMSDVVMIKPPSIH